MEYCTLRMTRCVPEEEEDSKCPMTLHESKVRPRCLDQLEAVGATYRMIQSQSVPNEDAQHCLCQPSK